MSNVKYHLTRRNEDRENILFCSDRVQAEGNVLELKRAIREVNWKFNSATKAFSGSAEFCRMCMIRSVMFLLENNPSILPSDAPSGAVGQEVVPTRVNEPAAMAVSPLSVRTRALTSLLNQPTPEQLRAAIDDVASGISQYNAIYSWDSAGVMFQHIDTDDT